MVFVGTDSIQSSFGIVSSIVQGVQKKKNFPKIDNVRDNVQVIELCRMGVCFSFLANVPFCK